MKNIKIRSIKTFEQPVQYSPKAIHTWLLWIRNSCQANILLRSQALQFAKICSLQISSRKTGHTFMEISLNLVDFSDFSKYYIILFYIIYRYIIFFKQFFLTYPVIWSEHCLTLENYKFSRFFLCSQHFWFKETKRIALDLTDLCNQVYYR